MTLLALRPCYWGQDSRDFLPDSFLLVFGRKKKKFSLTLWTNIMVTFLSSTLNVSGGEGLDSLRGKVSAVGYQRSELREGILCPQTEH